jgi:hypothetical protein
MTVASTPPREPDRRILPFRRPGSLPRIMSPLPPAVADLAKFEGKPEEPDDFRHRMKMNVLALAATALLVMVGIWIADVMASMRKNQDCVLSGRPGCTRVEVPAQPR